MGCGNVKYFIIIMCNGCDFQSLLFMSVVPETHCGFLAIRHFLFLFKNEVREFFSAALWRGLGSASSHFHQSIEGRETRSVLPFK